MAPSDFTVREYKSTADQDALESLCSRLESSTGEARSAAFFVRRIIDGAKDVRLWVAVGHPGADDGQATSTSNIIGCLGTSASLIQVSQEGQYAKLHAYYNDSDSPEIGHALLQAAISDIDESVLSLRLFPFDRKLTELCAQRKDFTSVSDGVKGYMMALPREDTTASWQTAEEAMPEFAIYWSASEAPRGHARSQADHPGKEIPPPSLAIRELDTSMDISELDLGLLRVSYASLSLDEEGICKTDKLPPPAFAKLRMMIDRFEKEVTGAADSRKSKATVLIADIETELVDGSKEMTPAGLMLSRTKPGVGFQEQTGDASGST